MGPNWNDLQQQLGEENNWSLESVFDPNMILTTPLFPPPEEPVPEDPDMIE
jgi:hypothetical protein